LIDKLIGLLSSSSSGSSSSSSSSGSSKQQVDDLTIEIACYDIGEFARFHPDGKKLIQQRNGKRYLMEWMSQTKNPQIARQALTAVQKLMVAKWEVLDKATSSSKSGSSSSSSSSSATSAS